MNTLSDLYIAYRGEDECFWRFILMNGKWREESGEIKYDSDYPVADKQMFIGKIIDVIQDECVDNRQGDIIEGKWYNRVYSSLEQVLQGWKIVE